MSDKLFNIKWLLGGIVFLCLGLLVFSLYLTITEPIPDSYQVDDSVIKTASTSLECNVNKDCETPPKYLIQSRCPFGSACMEGKCEVVCPVNYFEGESCQNDNECSCEDYKAQDLKACKCVAGKCVVLIDQDI